ncbi:MarR family winged helix-turn-helix transcriptional regulator [Sphingomonas sp. ac-8]|uniref:MarR family winged helix-turn-helix transcriptional regulator n=1 Tax=Sphingomonas sp. ac-8 TaxID=3242977 RepID=UPI003A80B542
MTESLLNDFGRLFLRLRRIADAELAREGASLARMKLLMYVQSQHPSVRAADIASYFGHSPRTVSEAIEGLERDGMIRRTPDPSDGRVKRIALTPAGEAVIASAEPLRTRLNEAIFGVLAPEDRQRLRETLAQLDAAADALEQQGGLGAEPPPPGDGGG